jgi:N-methylhydantoinase A/oxoprolinase/acetone carboxylase beta subunit
VAKIVNGIEHLTRIAGDTILAGFGGGGPMLLTMVAAALGIKQAIIPGMAPVFSAYGIGFSDLSQHYQVHVDNADPDALMDARATLLERARRDMFAEATTIEDCRLDWSVVSLGEKGGVQIWANDAPPPGLEERALLRLESSKPIERLSLEPNADLSASEAPNTATRRIQIHGDSIDVPLYRFPELEVGATGVGPCIVEDDFFTARIDVSWRFALSNNRDLLLERGTE